MSLYITTSERVFPGLHDKKDDFLKQFSDEMARRGFKLKTSRESGFDLIYSDMFGEAKIYAISDGSVLRFGYRMGVSFIVFILAVLFPILDLIYTIVSAIIVMLWVMKILILKGALNEAAQNTYLLLKAKSTS
ncbi:MAG: hypothetical protein NDF54_02760 [archaeon GB-1867-035]|nr:hypothetical protein [Candidatus Culexmicrobium profundum]